MARAARRTASTAFSGSALADNVRQADRLHFVLHENPIMRKVGY